MKKALLLSVLAVATLTACGGTANNEAKETVEAALNEITLNETYNEDFTLTTSGLGGVTISWTSSDTDVISISGGEATVSRPTDEDASVTLTATATYEEYSQNKTFTVTVEQLEIGEYLSVEEAYALPVEESTKYNFRGIVTGFVYNASGRAGCLITDNTGTIYVFGSTMAKQVKKGDDIFFAAERDDYFGAAQLAYPDLNMVIGSGKDYSTEAFTTGKTVEEVYGMSRDEEQKFGLIGNVYVASATITWYQGSSYNSWEVEDPKTGAYIAAAFSDNEELNSWLDPYKGQTLDVAFVPVSYTSKGQLQMAIIDVFPDGYAA